MPDNSLQALVATLPERYQPVFAHPEFDAGASRPCTDRLDRIASVVSKLRDQLGRPVRILDLGCAQGFFALSLAAAGNVVTGVDRLQENVDLCVALAGEHPTFATSFVCGNVEDVVSGIAAGDYDVVLALSVIHHLCHERGLESAAKVLQAAATKADVLLAEVALQSEPVYWASAQPLDARDFFVDFAFVHIIAEHATHLSDIVRPLFFASSRWWCLGDEIVRFDHWTREQHELAGNVHLGTRRYYFSANRLAKYFVFSGPASERNRSELAGEIVFLRSPPPGMRQVPALHSHAILNGYGWLVRDLLPGRRVSELIAAGEELDRVRVVQDVLDDLCALEAAGLYHGDVRIWNVILGDDGRSTLIDYGDISATPEDCAWPHNIFLSFLVFLHELQGEQLPRIVPIRSPSFAPHHFSEPYRSWLASVWQDPVENWTFAGLRESLRAALAALGANSELVPPPIDSGPWQTAMEQHLDALGGYQKQLADHVRDEMVRRGNVLQQLLESVATARNERTLIERALEDNSRALTEQLHPLVEKLSARIAELHEVRAAETRLRGELEQVRAGIGVRDATIRELGITLADVRRDAAVARAQFEDALSDVQRDAAVARAQFEKSLADLSGDNSTVRAAMAEAQRDADFWRAEAAGYRGRLEYALSSWSWRLTAPLRWGKRLLKSVVATTTKSIRAALRPIAVAGSRAVLRRPALRHRLGTAMHRTPLLRRRMVTFARGAGLMHEATAESDSPQGAVQSDPLDPITAENLALTSLSDDARCIYSALRSATERNRPVGS